MTAIGRRLDSRLITLVAAAVVIAGALGLARPDVFLSSLNINSMLLQSSVIGLLSLAVAVTMLTGGIDLSINATANLTSIIVALFLSELHQGEASVSVGYAITCAGVVLGLLVGL